MATDRSHPDHQRAHFDRWPPDYDDSVQDIAGADLYPFAGYDEVLAGICREMQSNPGMNVLDVGTGTGNLARRVLDLGC